MSIKSLKSMKNRTNNKKKEEGEDNKGADLTPSDSPVTRPSNLSNTGGVKFLEKESLESCVRRVVAHLQEKNKNKSSSLFYGWLQEKKTTKQNKKLSSIVEDNPNCLVWRH
jgi:hypothetical protein